MPKFLWEDIALYVAPVFRAPAIPGLAHSKVSQRGRPQSLAQSIPPAWDRTFALRQCSRLPCSGRSSTQPSPNSAGLNSAEVSTQQVPSQQSLDSAKSQLSKSHLSNAQLKIFPGSAAIPDHIEEKRRGSSRSIEEHQERIGCSAKFTVGFSEVFLLWTNTPQPSAPCNTWWSNLYPCIASASSSLGCGIPTS